VAYACKKIEVCLDTICCDTTTGTANLELQVRLVNESGTTITDPDTGAVLLNVIPPVRTVSTTGCVCSCSLPVNVKASNPAQALPVGTHYVVTAFLNGNAVYGPVRVRIDGDVTYPVGAGCGGIPVASIVIGTPPAPVTDAYCQSVRNCVTGDITAAAALKVSKAGDTMTGQLSISAAAVDQLSLIGTGPSSIASVAFTTAGGAGYFDLDSLGNFVLGQYQSGIYFDHHAAGLQVRDLSNGFRTDLQIFPGASMDAARIGLNGRVNLGANAVSSDLGATLGVWGTSASRPTQIIRMAASQTVDALRIEDSAAAAIFRVGPATIGFYGTAPIAKQTGVAVTIGAVHAALTALGLIS
jgi:hypothetical protein